VALLFASAAPAWCAQEKPAVSRSEPKRLAISLQNQPWKKVLEWLADETRLPIVAPLIPAGTFTCAAPAGVSYTLPEVIDLMNEALMPTKCRLHRGPASILLLEADERLDPALVPTVSAEELARRGRTELIRVVVSLKALKAQQVIPELKRLLGPFGDIGTLADRLVLQDTAQNVRWILQTLREVDGRTPADAEAPLVRAYPVHDVESSTKTLQELFRNAPGVRIAGTPTGVVLVWGSPQDQEQVKNLLDWLSKPPTPKATELISLGTLQAGRAVETLKAMFGGRGGPYLEADASRNAIVVRGSREQVQEIKSVLGTLGELPTTGTTRIITLERGSAIALAEALRNLIRDIRPNPVRVIAPGTKGDPLPKLPAKEGEALPPDGAGVPRAPSGRGDESTIDTLVETQFRRLDRNGDGVLNDEEMPEALRVERDKWDANKDGLIDLNEYGLFVRAHSGEIQGKPANKPAPLTITVVGNRLIVACEDVEMLALVLELARQLTQTRAEGEFEIVRLRSGSAVEIAKVLDEALNGRGTAEGTKRARVVADPATNSLLVKANPLDQLTIRRLLRGALDSDREESGTEIRTWVIGPLKYAIAGETAKVLTAVYCGAGERTGFTVTADQRTNRVVLRCSPALYRDVVHLVEQLDAETPKQGK
jgi:hypothetical protein